MMLATTRNAARFRVQVNRVQVGADTTSKPVTNKYMNIGLVGAVGLLLIGQALPAAILLGSALGASAMAEGAS